MANINDDLNLDGEGTPRPRMAGASAPAPSRGQSQPRTAPRHHAHLSDYFKVLYIRRWTALTAFLLIVGTVTAYTFTVTPIYEARARLLMESDERNVVKFQQVVDEDQSRSDYYQTQFTILQSRALARETLDSLQLWDQAPFSGKPDGSFELGKIPKKVLSSAAGLFSNADEPEGARAADETAAQSRVIDSFLSGLSVTPVRGSRLFDVKYRLPNAALATTIVNAHTKNFIEQNLEYKFLASKEAGDWLEDRLGEQRKQVEQAQTALQQYRESNDAISIEDRGNIVDQKLSDLNAAVTRAKTLRIEKEALYNQLRASQSNPEALDAFPAILSNSYIQQLKGELGELQRTRNQLGEKLLDGHPDMKKLVASIQSAEARLSGEIGKVVQSVRSDYQAALSQENSLAAALSEQKNAALSMNRKAIEYGVLRRDVESSQQIYDSLMQRSKETGVAGELKTSNIRVVDSAERPRQPISPNRKVNVLLGLMAGVILGCGAAFFFDYLDSRIKTPDDIQNYLGLSCLGLVPVIRGEGEKRYPLLTGGVPGGFGEALRGVRTNMLFSTAHEGSRSVVVTSTGPGEGKSMVSSNLAVGLAQAGQRVLLIDADMRKPKAHLVFGLPQDPGLSNLLVGQSKASETVRRTDVADLWVLTAGRLPPNPSELVGSAKFRQFLTSLQSHFDWVLIDSPPVMAVTDAAVISHVVSGVLFVVGAGMTSRHAAQRALDNLEQAQARFVGAVLNRVDLERNPYYFREYYRKEYADYYVKSV